MLRTLVTGVCDVQTLVCGATGVPARPPHSRQASAFDLELQKIGNLQLRIQRKRFDQTERQSTLLPYSDITRTGQWRAPRGIANSHCIPQGRLIAGSGCAHQFAFAPRWHRASASRACPFQEIARCPHTSRFAIDHNRGERETYVSRALRSGSRTSFDYSSRNHRSPFGQNPLVHNDGLIQHCFKLILGICGGAGQRAP